MGRRRRVSSPPPPLLLLCAAGGAGVTRGGARVGGPHTWAPRAARPHTATSHRTCHRMQNWTHKKQRINLLNHGTESCMSLRGATPAYLHIARIAAQCGRQRVIQNSVVCGTARKHCTRPDESLVVTVVLEHKMRLCVVPCHAMLMLPQARRMCWRWSCPRPPAPVRGLLRSAALAPCAPQSSCPAAYSRVPSCSWASDG